MKQIMTDYIWPVAGWVFDNWEFMMAVVIPWLYEKIARRVPTEKDLSLLNAGYKVLEYTVGKNRRKLNPNDEVHPEDDKKNIVVVDRTKHIIGIILLLIMALPFCSIAQNYVQHKEVQLIGATPATEYAKSGNGRLFYDGDANALMGKDATGWFNLRSSGGSSNPYLFIKRNDTTNLHINDSTTITLGAETDFIVRGSPDDGTAFTGLSVRRHNGGFFDDVFAGAFTPHSFIGVSSSSDAFTMFNTTGQYNVSGGSSDMTFNDNRGSKHGIVYGGTGYVTQTHSLADKEYVDAKIVQTITNGVTTTAPSQDAVFDALALKGAGTVTSIGITAPAAGITASGTPVTGAGSITLALANDLAAVEGLSTTGIVRRTGTSTWSAGTAVDLTTEVTGALPLANGGTGSATKNFVDLSTNQTGIAGNKTWTGQQSYTNSTSTGAGSSSGFFLAANSLTSGQAVNFNTNSIVNGNLFDISSSSTAFNGGSLGSFSSSGTNAAGSQTATGLKSIITNTGTTSTNIAGYFSASGATTNKAIAISDGIFEQVRTSNFSTTDKFFVLKNNTSTETFSQSSNGTFINSLYNTSGTLVGDLQLVMAGGTMPSLRFRNTSATNVYDFAYNPTSAYILLYNSTSATSTKVGIGSSSGTPGATVVVTGPNTTTGATLRVEGSSNGLAMSVNAQGDAVLSKTLVVGGSTITAGTVMDIQSTTLGLGIPRMTTTQRNALTNLFDGELVANTTSHTIDWYNGTAWSPINRLRGYTVATLPAGTVGDTAYVTDALAPSFLVAVTGGGSVVTPVFYNGTNWVAQ